MRFLAGLSFGLVLALASPFAWNPVCAEGTSATSVVGGMSPDRRPEGAPVVQDFQKDGAWFDRALAGVSEPYPWSLRFLEDQEGWYTPFNRPGMRGRYDIRNWHED